MRDAVQAVVYLGVEGIAAQDVPPPQDGGVLIDVEACGICGTDLAIAKGAHPRAKPGLILGHEFVGHLAEDAPELRRGTRVTCFPLISCGACQACRSGRAHICARLNLFGIDAPGGMAAQVRIPANQILIVPPELPADVAAQIEPLAVCTRAAAQAKAEKTDTALILGAGPIGATLALTLRHLGLKNIILAELNPARRAAVEALGFTACAPDPGQLNEHLRGSEAEGFDLVFDCAGVPAAAQLAQSLTRSGGRLIMVAVHKAPVALDLRDINFREITLIGTRVYTEADFATALNLLPALATGLSTIVSRTEPFSAAATVFYELSHGAPDLKVILHP